MLDKRASPKKCNETTCVYYSQLQTAFLSGALINMPLDSGKINEL